jgi:hypothetical protein
MEPNVTIRLEPEGRNGSAFDLQRFILDPQPSAEQQTKVDVILVHGLTGDPVQTWGGKVENNGHVSDCWPAKLAIELKAKATFWTMRCPFYGLNVQEKTLGRNFEADAKDALSQFAGKLGGKPIIFVAHSLGGLLVKKMLDLDINSGNAGRIAARTHTVMFIGTPHCGSPHVRWHYLVPFLTNALGWSLAKLAYPLAVSLLGAGTGALVSVDIAGWFKWDLGSSAVIGAACSLLAWLSLRLLKVSRHLKMLNLGEPDLLDLAAKYRELVARWPIITLCFTEDEPLYKFFHIVPRYSADPGIAGCDPIGISANHIDMCKGTKATKIREAIVRHVEMASGNRAVFEDRLANIFCDERYESPLNAFTEKVNGELRFRKKFTDVPVQDQDNVRGEGEEKLRIGVRNAIATGDFKAGNGDLERARVSPFDVDGLVWSVWHEQQFTKLMRDLKMMAEQECKSWPGIWQSNEYSLMPFFRPLRTISHSLLLDRTDLGREKKDREVLLSFIEDASLALGLLSKTGADGNGRTRWLLLQLYCLLKTAGTIEKWFELIWDRLRDKPSPHCEALLQDYRTEFDTHLGKVESWLSQQRDINKR